ncbi:MAG: ATP-binding protein [Prevotella sp.]|nr:ATP-binding protein [Prevotella sp.]
MVTRILGDKLKDISTKYPVLTITGPRQSGKSTLVKATFPDYRYVSLEDPDIREFAQLDPRGFIATYHSRVIIDEAQRVPQLFSYIQSHVDEYDECGMYILSGSHNFLLMETISQSLAGRTAVFRLLPFSHEEMKNAGILPEDINTEIFMGSYPRIYDKNISPVDYYPHYIQTYVERDIRQLKNVSDLGKFTRFIKLCAGRIGQLLNISSLANECGVSVPTATSWLSLLETSYICYTLKPDWNNYSKRLVKTPKLYFHDTGLACSLLGIQSPTQVDTHFLRGGLFENMVINSFIKRYYNAGRESDLRFWRDSTGNEVDLLCYDGDIPTAYEVKSGATYNDNFFNGLTKWASLSGVATNHLNVIYGGSNNLETSKGHLVAWR